MGAALVLLLVALGAMAAGVLIGRYYVPDDRQLRRTARHSRAYMRALSHLVARDYETVLTELRAVVEENIEDVEPYFALGAVFRSRGEHERAIRVHQALAVRERDRRKLRQRAMYELGLDFRAAGMPRRATRAMEKVLVEDPAHEGGLRVLAALYEEQARFNEAAGLWQRLGRRRGEDTGHREHHLLVAAAQAALGRDDLDSAKQLLKSAQKHEESAHFFTAAAELAAARGNHRSAKERLKQALIADPGLAPHLLPGMIAAEQGLAAQETADHKARYDDDFDDEPLEQAQLPAGTRPALPATTEGPSISTTSSATLPIIGKDGGNASAPGTAALGGKDSGGGGSAAVTPTVTGKDRGVSAVATQAERSSVIVNGGSAGTGTAPVASRASQVAASEGGIVASDGGAVGASTRASAAVIVGGAVGSGGTAASAPSAAVSAAAPTGVSISAGAPAVPTGASLASAGAPAISTGTPFATAGASDSPGGQAQAASTGASHAGAGPSAENAGAAGAVIERAGRDSRTSQVLPILTASLVSAGPSAGNSDGAAGAIDPARALATISPGALIPSSGPDAPQPVEGVSLVPVQQPPASIAERVLAVLADVEAQCGPRLEIALIRAQLLPPSDAAGHAELAAELMARFPDALAARVAVARLAIVRGDASVIRKALEGLVADGGALAWTLRGRWQCAHCGHRPGPFSWRCAQCRRWSTLRMETGIEPPPVAPRDRRAAPRTVRTEGLLGVAPDQALPTATLDAGLSEAELASAGTRRSLLGRVGGWFSGVWRRD